VNGGGTLATAKVAEAPSVFRVDGVLKEVPTAFYERTLLPVDEPFEGPAIILQTDSTTVVPPGATVTADAGGNLLVRIGG
jgi:N-methylhydantoinase A